MNAHSQWRFALAERIAASYGRNPKVQVIMVAGSVGRGTADRYSDLEVDIYYSEPPTVEERIAGVQGCSATVELLDEDPDEWEEQMLIDGFHASTSTFLISTMERYLREVVDECQIAPEAQCRLYSLQHAVPLHGHELVNEWRAKAAQYPDGLVHAMLREHLPFDGFWYAEDMLAAHDDLIALHDIFVRVERHILGALLGLNRQYMPTPGGMKWMDEMIASMQIKPPDLSVRMKRAFHAEPADGVRELKQLINEVLDLVAQHAPAFDLASYCANTNKHRPVWDGPPSA